MDLNIRVIKAVECCPTLYKGNASIEQRQVVWQQLAEQMRVPESVLKTRWHLLCNWYQRCLEKRRSTDDANENEAGADRNDFRYEAEMAFLMPYIHARIAIAAANAARKQQELALAGANDLTEPEFVITENDIEQATTVSNELSTDYTFYEVETFEQEQEGVPDTGEGVNEIIESSQEALSESDYIQHIDESGNIVVQDIIYETGDQLSDGDGDGGEIEVEDEEILQMDDQIEVQNEQIIEEVAEDESHAENEDDFITDKYDVMTTETTNPRTLRLPTNRGQKYIKIIELKPDKDIQTPPAKQAEVEESPTSFAQEYTLTTRRRNAVVIKATPRVQVELTDNAAANVLQQRSENVENTADSSTSKSSNTVESTPVETPATVEVEKEAELSKSHENKLCQIENNENEKEPNHHTKPQEQVSTINSTASLSTSTAATSTSSATPAKTDEQISSDTTKTERSEDTIFGELVAAMLKKMPSERKRAIKRSIMDVLLT